MVYIWSHNKDPNAHVEHFKSSFQGFQRKSLCVNKTSGCGFFNNDGLIGYHYNVAGTSSYQQKVSLLSNAGQPLTSQKSSKHLEYNEKGPDEFLKNCALHTLDGSGISLTVVDSLIRSVDDVLCANYSTTF